nr:hypothetical protein CFP56_08563 [Quercus suber]
MSRTQSNGSLKIDQQQFGSFLRAPPYKFGGRDVIHVPGYYKEKSSKTRKKRAEIAAHMAARAAAATLPPKPSAPEQETKEIGRSINSSMMEFNVACNEEEEYVEEENLMGDSFNLRVKEKLMPHNDSALAPDSVSIQNSKSVSPNKETINVENGNPIISEIKAGQSQLNAVLIPSSNCQRLATINEETLAASSQELLLHCLDVQDESHASPSTAENLGQHLSLRTWKHVMRQGNNGVPTSNSEPEKKRKSIFTQIDGPLIPNKRLQHDLLSLLFSPRDKELILSIRLCGKPVEDALVWPFTPTGSYTMKSSYRFLHNSRSMDFGEYHPEENKLWKKVWGMHVQPKVRNFLWRAIRNSIPTKINLKRRMVLMDECCDHCHEEPEEVLHALWSCPSISQAWTQFDTWGNLDPSPCFSSFKDLVETVVEEGKDLNYFATTVWAIWSRINSMRTSGQHIPVQQIYSAVQKARAAYVRTIPPRPPDQTIHCEQRSTWKPPPRSKLKVNFDGSVFSEVQRAGVGAIVRDAEGSVLASMAESFHLPFSVATVEVIAAMKSIQFTKDLGLTSFILKGDSKSAIEGLKCKSSSLTNLTFSDKATKTCPSLSQITTPIPASCSSPNTTPSKFALMEFSAGGCHCTRPACFSPDKPCRHHKHLHVFTFNLHNAHEVMLSTFKYLFLTSAYDCSHTSRTCTQSQMAWTSYSFKHLHWSHTKVSTTILFFRLTFVGKALEQARQVNTFTLLGIFKCQMNFQKLFTPPESELEGRELNSFSHSS